MGSLSAVLFLTLVALSLVFSSPVPTNADSIIEGTELIYVFLTHRHGDRTPVKETMQYLGLDDYSEVEALIEPWGYGQLTDTGKRTGYMTGQFIRRRYDDFIPSRYNRSQVYIRSTDSTRTKMTVLTALSAIFPAQEDSWSDVINWDPVPYTTVPVKWDFNQAFLNCPKYSSYYYGAMKMPNSRMDVFSNVVSKVSEIVGVDISQTPVVISAVYDVYVSVNKLGFDIGDKIRNLMPEIEAAAGVSWDITTGNDNILPLEAGVALNEFFTYADQLIAGKDTQKLRILSAHDANVYAMQSISRVVPRQGAPKYGSVFSLEVRRVVATGQYVVLPVYLPDPHIGEEVYLQVDGCGDLLCDYNTFRNLTSSFIRDEDTWRTECGFSLDMKFDSSAVD